MFISQTTDFHFANYRFSFRKLQIFISQTTDFHFANYRFPFRKLQISISQTTDFHFVASHFVSFHFVSQTRVSQSILLKMPPDCRVFVFVTALVSGGVPDIIFVAQLIFKFGDHALIVDNRGLLLFKSECSQW